MLKANDPIRPSVRGIASLDRLVYFAAVVETGSFTAAADRLDITKAVVSQQVARLESELGTSLLTRTTRKVQPTEAGLALHRRCRTILREANDAFDELAEAAAQPTGTLRLTTTLDYGIMAVVPAVAEFSRKYPACKVDVVFTDQFLDLMSGEVELAIRVGWLREPYLQARRIGSFRQLLVAAPGWRAKVAKLDDPSAIGDLPFIANAALSEPGRWTFSRTGIPPRRVSVQPSIRLGATLAVREAVRAGAGLSVLPDYVVREDLEAGRLVQVLPGWNLPAGGIHAVFPSARYRPARVKAFVDLLVQSAREESR